MIVQTKAEKIKEIEFQQKMLRNLKKWITVLIILSTVFAGVSYWAIKLKDGLCYNIVGGISIGLMVISVIICATTGLAYKNGQRNVEKITSAL